MNSRRSISAIAVAVACSATVLSQPQPSLEEILERTSLYVDAFIKESASLVAEEDYVQRASAGPRSITRVLKSDMAIVFAGEAGWIAFRDVFEVDGHPVRDRDDRLARLFLTPSEDAFARAREIVAEGARYNISPQGLAIERTINVPVTALRFVERQNVARSDFELDWTTSDGQRLARLRFNERAEPRLIHSPDEAAASGELLVEPETGVVRQTVLTIRTGSTLATLTTRYAPQPRFRVWLPVSMEESYATFIPNWSIESRRIDGRATYSNFRTFGVSVDVETAQPE